jgi:hypothetical protein
MKLQKHVSRKTKNKTYRKWLITISDKIINSLGWKQGTDLKAEISDNKLILSSQKDKKIKTMKGEQKLSYYERFMRVYDNLPLSERKLPVVVINDEPISWAMCYAQIKQRTKLGKKIGEKLIKLEII